MHSHLKPMIAITALASSLLLVVGCGPQGSGTGTTVGQKMDRAADKVAEANGPPIPPAEPKPEWVAKDGLQVGGKGMKITTPF